MWGCADVHTRDGTDPSVPLRVAEIQEAGAAKIEEEGEDIIVTPGPLTPTLPSESCRNLSFCPALAQTWSAVALAIAGMRRGAAVEEFVVCFPLDSGDSGASACGGAATAEPAPVAGNPDTANGKRQTAPAPKAESLDRDTLRVPQYD